MTRKITAIAALLFSISMINTFLPIALLGNFWSVSYGNGFILFPVGIAVFSLFFFIGFISPLRYRLAPSHLFLSSWLAVVWGGAFFPLFKSATSYLESPILMSIAAGILSGSLFVYTVRASLTYFDRDKFLSLLFVSSLTTAGVIALIFFKLLPFLGHGKTALIIALTCLLPLLFSIPRKLPPKHALPICTLHIFFWSLSTFQIVTQAPNSELIQRQTFPRRTILFQKQSPFQKLVLTEEKGTDPSFPGIPQHILYRNGLPVFQSNNEQSNHTCLTSIPLGAARNAGFKTQNALVLGAGHGLVVRNLAMVTHIKHISVVQPDKELTGLASEFMKIRIYNFDSLKNNKVTIHNSEPFAWVRNNTELFELIIVAFPLPVETMLARYYSGEFYSLVLGALNKDGVLVIQAGPTHDSTDTQIVLSKTVACIRKTLSSIGQASFIYENSLSKEAFVISSPSSELDIPQYFKMNRMVSSIKNAQICQHNPNWKEPRVQSNTLNRLVIPSYLSAWLIQTPKPHLSFRGPNSIFLPD